MGTKLTGNDHWMTDFQICDFYIDQIFNMAVIEGSFFCIGRVISEEMIKSKIAEAKTVMTDMFLLNLH